MQTQFDIFFTVLRNILRESSRETIPENVEWDSLLRLAKSHKLLPFFVEEAVKNENFARSDLKEKYVRETVALTVTQLKKNDAFLRLYSQMAENDIHPIVLKGVVISNLYGKLAERRISGDEDVFIKKEDFEKTDEFLKSEGFVPDVDNVTESQKDYLQEVTYISEESNLRLEVHFSLLGTEDSFRKKMSGFFFNVFDNYLQTDVNGVLIRSLRHTEQLLFLVFHTLKHLTISGFGIRMALDILLYIEKYKDEIDFDYIYNSLKEVNAVSFFDDLIFIGNKYLGFNLEMGGQSNCPDELLEDILESGIYGNYSQARRTSVHVVHTAFATRKTSRKLGNAGLLFDTVFPPKERLLEICPDLEKKPWLIFDVYLKRMGRFISHNKENSNNLATESMKIGKKRIELLKKYKLL